MPGFDLNCDLGEGESPPRTLALLRLVTSANVACGGHAGDPETMERAARHALRLGVAVGAHPGWPDRAGHGRAEVTPSPAGLVTLLLQQVSALDTVARALGGSVRHLKLHGALYHATDRDPALAEAYLGAVRRWWPRLAVFARSGGATALRARELGLAVQEEVFLDRAYRRDGSLVPRGEPGALLVARDVPPRLGQISLGFVTSADGAKVPLRADTLCVHADSPGALAIARLASAAQRSAAGGAFTNVGARR
ncbi:MAG: 5-oxoprolinase subunit PxpA [Limisphaerales bacterium]